MNFIFQLSNMSSLQPDGASQLGNEWVVKGLALAVHNQRRFLVFA